MTKKEKEILSKNEYRVEIREARYEEALKVLKDPWTIRYWQWFNNTVTTATEDLREISSGEK